MSNVNGCDSIITLDLTVEEIDLTTAVAAETITANTSGSTYQWLNCDNGFTPISGATNQSYTATSNGNYAVVITQNGCSDTSTCSLISTVSTAEILVEDLVVIYPNPTSGKVNIDFIENQRAVTVRLINNLGQEVMSESFEENETITFYVRAESGMYTLEISSPEIGVLVSKLLKY